MREGRRRRVLVADGDERIPCYRRTRSEFDADEAEVMAVVNRGQSARQSIVSTPRNDSRHIDGATRTDTITGRGKTCLLVRDHVNPAAARRLVRQFERTGKCRPSLEHDGV